MSLNSLNDNYISQFPVGLNQSIKASVIDSKGRLIVGGAFTGVDGKPTKTLNRIAMFDRTEWVSIGDGFNNDVNELAIDEDDNIYAGGKFTADGTTLKPLWYIAKWDGSSWTQVGDGFNNDVYCLKLLPDGNLVAGGNFTRTKLSPKNVNCLGIWNGVTWEQMGLGTTGYAGSTGYVNCLTYYSNKLYIGGNFSKLNNISCNRIGVWDGSSWSPIGNGFNDEVTAIEFNNNEILFAGGKFGRSFDLSILFNKIAQWNGSSWSSMGGGLNGNVSSLKYRSDLNLLYVGGSFSATSDNATQMKLIGAWDGIKWMRDDNYIGITSVIQKFIYDRAGEFEISRPTGYGKDLGCGLNLTVLSSIIDKNGDLIVGGQYSGPINDFPKYNYVAKWNFTKNKWYSFGPGVNSNVWALALKNDGLSLTIAGEFIKSNAGIFAGKNYDEVTLNRIASWDGTNWNSIGSGFDSTVRAIAYDSQNNLYAGGFFSKTIGGADYSMLRIAMWNGSVWSQVGGGVNSPVYNMKFDKFGNLIVVGAFTVAGGINVNRIAGWTGSSWFAFNTGIANSSDGYGFNNEISALEFDSNGNMYIGGAFSINNNTSYRVAKITVSDNRWSTSSVVALSKGLDGNVLTLKLSYDGFLYAGGTFTYYGGQQGNRVGNIAKWNYIDSVWEPVDPSLGVNNTVHTIAKNLKHDIIIGGVFDNTWDTTRNLPRISYLRAKQLTTLSNFYIPNKLVNSKSFSIPQPTSNRAGSFIYSSSDDTIASISKNVIKINKAGQVTITAIQPTTPTYFIGTIETTLTINKLTPKITSFTIFDQGIDSPDITLSAKTNSDGEITYSTSNPLVATVTNNIVNIVNLGTVSISATTAETPLYYSKTVITTFTVYEQPPVDPNNINSGNGLLSLLATGSTSRLMISSNISLTIPPGTSSVTIAASKPTTISSVSGKTVTISASKKI
jgi:hypothetical protein